jgi:hypothetical protein
MALYIFASAIQPSIRTCGLGHASVAEYPKLYFRHLYVKVAMGIPEIIHIFVFPFST